MEVAGEMVESLEGTEAVVEEVKEEGAAMVAVVAAYLEAVAAEAPTAAARVEEELVESVAGLWQTALLVVVTRDEVRAAQTEPPATKPEPVPA